MEPGGSMPHSQGLQIFEQENDSRIAGLCCHSAHALQTNVQHLQ